ncbi:MAG: FAD-binding oxidoreductase [Rhizobiales bacterium]|nr:FAD-binding oxidoreductase [Hyphomicrobiales bacterium]
MNSSIQWDAIIVGAGIVGSSAAYYAARNGLRVLMIEKETPGAAQSGRNLGFIRQQGRDFRELSLAMGAMKLWTGLEGQLGRKVGWFQGGNLALAFTESDLTKQHEWKARAAEEFGLDTQILSPEQVKAKVPALSTHAAILGGMFTGSDGRIEPTRATRAFFEAALENGASVKLGATTARIDVSAGQVSGVWCDGEYYRAPVVICAAGTGSAKLLRDVGLDLPQERIRATVIRTAPKPEIRLDPCVSAVEFGVRQDVKGAFVLSVFGGDYDVRADSWRHMRAYSEVRKANPGLAQINVWAPLQRILGDGYQSPIADIPPTRDYVPPNQTRSKLALKRFHEIFPDLAACPLEASWGGILDTMPDAVPVIGPIDGINGLLVATGFSGHGFGPGPMAGKTMAEMAVGREAEVDLSQLSPMRFRRDA